VIGDESASRSAVSINCDGPIAGAATGRPRDGVLVEQ
jgi:hypothetical protein